jgi:histone deacetylase 6
MYQYTHIGFSLRSAHTDLTEQERVDSQAFYEQLSLYVTPGTTKAAMQSCGGTIEATLAVAQGDVQKSFAIVRPPGHHAEPDEHMGFCFFNNVAVAARVAQQVTPLKRIMILDWCVHTYCFAWAPSLSLLIPKGRAPW